MTRPRIYVTSRSFGKRCIEALELIESAAVLEINPYGRAMTEQELLRTVVDVEGLIVGGDEIDRKIMEHSRNLKIIARHGTGVDNIDLNAATENNIIVTYAPHVNADAVAEFVMGLILSLARHIPQAQISMSRGRWEPTRFVGFEVSGKTIGIVGLGEIGFRVARRAKAFDMRILYWSRRRKTDIEVELGVNYVSLETLLRESDFATLHVALTDETRGMIGKEEFELMRKNAYLINTARGPIVDETALYEALKDGKIAGAAIDVYCEEPPSAENPLLKLDNVIKTPHIAAYTIEAIRRMDMVNAEDIVNFFKGKKPTYIANPEVLQKISHLS